MMYSTCRILQDAPISQWSMHHFGISEKRWHALSNKSFWITGSGTGYGRCIAIALAAAGAQVFLTVRRYDKLEETLYEMKLLGIETERCQLVPADINDPTSVSGAVSVIQQACPNLYGLVHSAALPQPIASPRALLQISEESWDKLMSTNVTAAWRITREITPHMLKGKALRILFLTSEAGWAFTPGFGPYNVSKAALNNLGVSFAHEIASYYSEVDCQSNVLNPGEARTEMNQGSDVNPCSVVSMTLTLLSHPSGGPNGHVFHRDGRHLSFAYATKYSKSIL